MKGLRLGVAERFILTSCEEGTDLIYEGITTVTLKSQGCVENFTNFRRN